MWFQENPCRPDVLGLNHYVTSDRYLDADVRLYPDVASGGNGRHRYVDVEAVRVLESEDLGLSRRISEVWERYHAPIAITESHLGCKDSLQQLLWFQDAWRVALLQKHHGVNLIAVTSWALLGAYDWDSLLTRRDNHYERGAFEVINGQPELTPLAIFLRKLGREQTSDLLTFPSQGTGWWKHPSRFRYRPIILDRAEIRSAA